MNDDYTAAMIRRRMPPGYYPAPDGSGEKRYWTGQGWSGEAPPQVVVQQTSVWTVAGGVLLAVALAVVTIWIVGWALFG